MTNVLIFSVHSSCLNSMRCGDLGSLMRRHVVATRWPGGNFDFWDTLFAGNFPRLLTSQHGHTKYQADRDVRRLHRPQ